MPFSEEATGGGWVVGGWGRGSGVFIGRGVGTAASCLIPPFAWRPKLRIGVASIA